MYQILNSCECQCRFEIFPVDRGKHLKVLLQGNGMKLVRQWKMYQTANSKILLFYDF